MRQRRVVEVPGGHIAVDVHSIGQRRPDELGEARRGSQRSPLIVLLQYPSSQPLRSMEYAGAYFRAALMLAIWKRFKSRSSTFSRRNSSHAPRDFFPLIVRRSPRPRLTTSFANACSLA